MARARRGRVVREHARPAPTSIAPDTTHAIWNDNRQFFHRGSTGQWRDLLDDDDLAHYRRRVAELAADDLAEWAAQRCPAGGVGQPTSLSRSISSRSREYERRSKRMPQPGQVGHVVVGDLGLARRRGLDRARRDDVGEVRVERGERGVVGKLLHAQHEIAVDEPQRVVVAVEAGDLRERDRRRRR